jgi:hypothetical protein
MMVLVVVYLKNIRAYNERLQEGSKHIKKVENKSFISTP